MGNAGLEGLEREPNHGENAGVIRDRNATMFRATARNFKARRQFYTRAQKERAIRLLDLGIPCREVAQIMGPHCSSATPIRWRNKARPSIRKG